MRFRSVLASLSAGLLLAACATGGVVIDSGPPGPGPAATLGIPPGHLPPPGQCRIWIRGRPPGHQPAPGSCVALVARVPADGWLVYNPGREARGRGDRGRGEAHIRVTVYAESRPEVIRYYERESGKLVGKEKPPN